MISCYFGCPGCGKSSVLTLIAQRELKRIKKGKSKYTLVFTNFSCNGCYRVDFRQLGKAYYHDALILLDELTLSADARDYKTFPQDAKEFITLHRHFRNDIIFAVQDYSRAEKTIRENVVNLYYLSNIANLFTVSRPIYRTIAINEYIGDLIMGYRFPKMSELLFGGLHIYPIYKARKYFNSYDKFGFDKKPDPVLIEWKHDEIDPKSNNSPSTAESVRKKKKKYYKRSSSQ